MITEKNILIWLNSIGISNGVIIKLYEYFDNLCELWTVSEDLLRSSGLLRNNTINKIIKYRNIGFLEETLMKINKYKIKVTTIIDDEYPQNLINIDDRPTVLYGKGDYVPDSNLAIGIVGSRKATAYGKWACEKFTKELVNLDVAIVSGLATGIDAIAHKVAIESGGKTIGVLGNGIDKVYPKSNARLYEDVANNGLVLTEFPLGTDPFSYNFPQRNRIIAGLSRGILVIEAKEKSGSLITAHLALDQGKDIFALPGNINSIYSGGTNKLIKDGARPLLSIDDIIEEIYELQLKLTENKKNDINLSNLSDDETKIMKIILEGPIHADLISFKLNMYISDVISILTILELKGLIKELSARTFMAC